MSNALNAKIAEIQNIARERSIVAVYKGTEAWLRVLFAVVFFNVLDRSGEIVVPAYLSAALVIVWPLYFFVYLRAWARISVILIAWYGIFIWLVSFHNLDRPLQYAYQNS